MAADVIPIKPGMATFQHTDMIQRVRELKFGFMSANRYVPRYLVIGGNPYAVLLEQVKRLHPEMHSGNFHQIHELIVVRVKRDHLEVAS